jgi:hypothetical protein
MLVIATVKEVVLLLFHTSTKYGTDRFRVLCIFEQECAIESFYLWENCLDLKKGSFVPCILIYGMSWLVDIKVAK